MVEPSLQVAIALLIWACALIGLVQGIRFHRIYGEAWRAIRRQQALEPKVKSVVSDFLVGMLQRGQKMAFLLIALSPAMLIYGVALALVPEEYSYWIRVGVATFGSLTMLALSLSIRSATATIKRQMREMRLRP